MEIVKIRLKPGKDKSIERKHPWIFSGAIKLIEGNINEGDFIYLIGETGSGKSSLLKSLYKEIDFQKGFISVGEFNLNNIKKNKIASLRRQLGIIFQDFQLLSDRTTMYYEIK